MKLAVLLSDMQVLQLAIEGGETLMEQAFAGLDRRIRALAPRLARPDLERLAAAMAELEQSALKQQVEVVEELARLNSGRRAARGYVSLRSCSQGQRVRTKA